MGTNKEKTPSAAMKKLLLQSASKKEQEIQQIGSVAENAATQPPTEKSEEIKEIAPATDTVQEVQPEPVVEVELPVQENKKAEESKESGKKFSEYLEEHKLGHPGFQRNPQKAETNCHGYRVGNAQHCQQYS